MKNLQEEDKQYPKTLKELFVNTGIEPTIDKNGNTHYHFKAIHKKEHKEESKQETLEEASWKYNPVRKLDNEFIRAAFIAGANYQTARMYSEDEVINLLYDFYNHTSKLQSLKLDNSLNIKDWFNKLKKK